MPASFLVAEQVSNDLCLLNIRRVDCEEVGRRPFEQRTDVAQLVSDLLTRVKRVPEPGAEDKAAGGLDYACELVAGVGLNAVPKRDVIQKERDAADLEQQWLVQPPRP
jgi:hypothetical protein